MSYSHDGVLKLRPGVAIISMAEAVQLRAGDEEILVVETDAPEVVAEALSRLARGCHKETLREAVGEDQQELVSALLERVAAEGLLLDRSWDDQDEVSRYLSNFPRRPGESAEDPLTGRVAVIAAAAGGQLLAQALREHGLQVVLGNDAGVLGEPHGGRPAVAVCLWEQPSLVTAVEVNTAACRSQTPCLFADLSHGRHATLGPFYLPGEGACYMCFRRRWRENTAAPAEFEAAEAAMLDPSRRLPAYGMLPAFRYQLVGLASSELSAFFFGHRPLRTLNRIVTADLDGLEVWSEPCWQIPWCPICGVEDEPYRR